MDFFGRRESYSLILLVLLFRVSEASFNFTKEPSNPKYVINGSTTKLIWDYTYPQNQIRGIVFAVSLPGLDVGTFKKLIRKENGEVKIFREMPSAFKGRVNIEGKATLVIDKITPADNAEFRANLIPKTGKPLYSKVKLIVAEPPEISISSVQKSYREGSSVNISCKASGKPPSLTTWIRKGSARSSGMTAAFLTINDVRREDNGVYTCKANNSIKIVSQDTTLLVHYKPEGTMLETNAPKNTTTQGGKVTFTCGVTAAKPPVSQYRFVFNGTEVSISIDGKYTISNVSRSLHRGKYKCVPSNSVGNGSEASLILDVDVPVHFTVLPQNVTENKTNPISMSCDASGFPAPSIKWTKSGLALPYNKHLIIQKSGESDAGEYVCTASNRVGKPKTAKAYVTVQYSPEIQKITQSSQKSWIGQTVSLNCVSDGVPTPTLTWYKPDKSVLNRARGRQKQEQVTLRRNEDFGEYKCIAANGLVPAEETVTIEQIKTPGKPSIAVQIQASSLTVTWSAPTFDGGSPITAYRVILLKSDTEIDSVNVTDPRSTSHTFSSLERYTNYVVKVLARNFVFEGDAVLEAVKTKFEGPPATVEIEDLPNKTTESTITLRWKEPEKNGKEITKYTVYQRIIKHGMPGNWTEVQIVTDLSVRQVEVALQKGEVYEFAVTATNQHGESVKQDETDNRVEAIEKPTGSDRPQTGSGDGNGMNTAIYAGAAAAVVLLIIGSIVIFFLWRRRKPFIHEEVSVDRPGSENHYEAEDGYQLASSAEAAQSLQAPGTEAEANYAQVDMTKRKKNRQPPTDEYAEVDMSKKTKKRPKRPGELEYAELEDLRAALTPGPSGVAAVGAVVRPPVYEGTDYADISQFGVPPPDPTYANVSKGDVTYSNLNSI